MKDPNIQPVFQVGSNMLVPMQAEANSSRCFSVGRWTKDEHTIFIKGKSNYLCFNVALQSHGKQWGIIQSLIPKRSTSQIRTHAQKFFIKLAQKAPKHVDLIQFMQGKPVSFFLNLSCKQSSNENSSEGNAESNEKPKEKALPNKRQIPEKSENLSEEAEERPRNKQKQDNLRVSLNLREEKNKQIEEKKENIQRFPPNYIFPPPNIMELATQSTVIKETLRNISTDLNTLFQQLVADINERKKENETDQASAEYWNYLYSCLSSLQYLVRDIMMAQDESISMNHLQSFQRTGYYPMTEREMALNSIPQADSFKGQSRENYASS